jgi:hypothetical protein
MGKMLIAVALALALVRVVDVELFYGKYTDTAIFVTQQVLRSFGF